MVSGVVSGLARHKVLAIVVAAVVVAALVATLVTKPWSAFGNNKPIADPAPGDKVLQTVNLTMGTDGALTAIGDTMIVSRAGTNVLDTTQATYEPTKVVDQLPVRVLTAYRTDKSAGTNLADLKGYTGRITMDLTVENLTVQPQKLTYDSAGRSLTATAMVGVPLTVVASASLPKTGAATIVTAANTTEPADATNGVISKAADDTTQVQWATILAPPQLAATATLRLVVDAKDFTLPALDLSVQPGLITDPSVGALVNSAFNPKNSDELALQTRTIDLIGDVNSVVVQAGQTISRVRKTLASTRDTLGTKTVTSLKQDTTSINSSLRSSSSNIKSLGKSLDSSLKSTNSSTLSALSATVDKLSSVLGDPGASASAPKVTGTGCDQSVAKPQSGTSVYGTLAQVSAQLDAYATATTACKTELQSTILSTLGPADIRKCSGSTSASVTCSLSGISGEFLDIANDLRADADKATAGLNPNGLTPIFDSLTQLTNQLKAVLGATTGFCPSSSVTPTPTPSPTLTPPTLSATPPVGPTATDTPTPTASGPPTPAPTASACPTTTSTTTPSPSPSPTPTNSLGTALNGLDANLKAAEGSYATILDLIGRLHDGAVSGVREVDGFGGKKGSLAQNNELADRICELIGNDLVPAPGSISRAQADNLRRYLTGQPCPESPLSTASPTPTLDPPAGYTQNMQQRLTDQRALFQLIADNTDVGVTNYDPRQPEQVGPWLAQLGLQLRTTRGYLDQARVAASSNSSELNTKLTALFGAVEAANAAVTEVEKQTDVANQQYTTARTNLDSALAAAGNKAATAAQNAVKPQIRQVAAQANASSDQVGRLFTRSAAGLSGAADSAKQDSGQAIEDQRKDLAGTQADAEESLDRTTKSALSGVASDVTSATRDLEGTRTLLSRDLTNILTDLGDPKVKGRGVLGLLATASSAANSADYQLALASDKASAYGSVRNQDVDGINLRQAQAEAALQRQADLPAFVRQLPATVEHRTVYVFTFDGK